MDETTLSIIMEAVFAAEADGSELNITEAANALADYAASRSVHLATLVGQPGFQEALIAERNNVALRAGIAASQTANSAESRFLGVLQGALAVGAQALLK